MKQRAVFLALFVFLWKIDGSCPQDSRRANGAVESLKVWKYSSRLPKVAKPTHYLIKLRPHQSPSSGFGGYVELEVEVLHRTSRIRLHLDGLEIRNDSVKVKQASSGRRFRIKRCRLDKKRQFYTIQLRRRLRPRNVYQLSMEYEGTIRDVPSGLFRTSYTNIRGEKTWLIATQLWPTEARKVFPCFDEPSMKATFDVHIAREKKKTVISNMPLSSSVQVKNDSSLVWDEFTTTLPMSTYLLAFAIMDFPSTKVIEEEGKILLRLWTRASMANQTEGPLRVTSKVLPFFEFFFDLRFPLPKLDMISLPQFAFGGLEGWGLITFRESWVLNDPNERTVKQMHKATELVAHEVAHQWFGDLVTFEWWNDLWLSEGFATYMAYVALNEVEDDFDWMELFVVERQLDAMALDGKRDTHAVRVEIENSGDIHLLFDLILYSKESLLTLGASLIRMMSHFLTRRTFRKGIRNYLQEFKYRSCNQTDLWHHLTRAAHEDGTLQEVLSVQEVMDTWTLQKGFPLVTVRRSEQSNNATLLQEAFFEGMTEEEEEENHASGRRWWIPITFTDEERPSFRHTQAQTWLRQEDQEITVTGLPSSDKWILFNLQHTGFYRVNYDENNWNLLVNQLHEGHEAIHVMNRAQLVSDALVLAKEGLLSYGVALNLTSYLRRERDYIPWVALMQNLEFLHLVLKETSLYGAFKALIRDIMEPLIDELGFEDDLRRSRKEHLLQADLIEWACHLGHPECDRRAQEALRKWMTTGVREISPGLLSPFLCSAVGQGSEEEWEYVLLRYASTQSPHLKASLRRALSCSRHIWLGHRYLEAIFIKDDHVFREDVGAIVADVVHRDVAHSVLWDFLLLKWETLPIRNETYSALRNFMTVVTQGFSTQLRLDEVRYLAGLAPPASRGAFLSAEKQVVYNANWRRRSLGRISAWLADYDRARASRPRGGGGG